MTKRAGQRYPFAMSMARKFIVGARRSGILLIPTSGVAASVIGLRPLIRVSQGVLNLILLVWFWNFIVFLICGAMILGAWLIDRYGDLPSDEDV